MLPPIFLRRIDLEIERNILHRHVPDQEGLAFGSHVNGTARKYTDLDLGYQVTFRCQFASQWHSMTVSRSQACHRGLTSSTGLASKKTFANLFSGVRSKSKPLKIHLLKLKCKKIVDRHNADSAGRITMVQNSPDSGESKTCASATQISTIRPRVFVGDELGMKME